MTIHPRPPGGHLVGIPSQDKVLLRAWWAERVAWVSSGTLRGLLKGRSPHFTDEETEPRRWVLRGP